MEGVSDDAADVLRHARATGAFVFRGTGTRPKLLYTGTLAYVLKFARALHRSRIDASVTFMGGGEDLAELRELAALDERITVKPFATGTGFAREVARADFLLNPRDPSWPGADYSFPWKLFEYLCHGKPIVSTRLSGGQGVQLDRLVCQSIFRIDVCLSIDPTRSSDTSKPS
jgi:glycosyltransferase involved in cell wall biosynthesis